LKKLEGNTLKKNKFFLIFILLLHSMHSFAYDGDKNKPIFLESDSAKWDEASQKSTYRGNVTVTQGSMLLTGNLLIVLSRDNEIYKMVITGEKSTYRQKTENGKIINGEARKIQYFVDGSKIIFLDKAILTQSNNIVKSNKIIYKTDTENIIAGDNKGKSRVKMTLEPQTKDE